MKISKDVSNMLKGIAAFWVLVNHICIWGENIFVLNPILRETTARLSDVGMFSFLFISGYGLDSSCNIGG